MIAAEGNELLKARCEQIRQQMTESSSTTKKSREAQQNWLAVLLWLKWVPPRLKQRSQLRLEEH